MGIVLESYRPADDGVIACALPLSGPAAMTLSAIELSALGASDVLAGLIEREPFRGILDLPRLHRCHGPGDVVIRKGSTPAGMFVVLQGTLEMMLSNRSGGEHMVRIAKAGHCLGLESALGDVAAVYELRSVAEASLLFVPTETMMAWIQVSPVFSRRLMALLAEDVADLYEELDGLQNRSTIERLACYLHCGEGRVCRGEPLRDDYTLALPYNKLAQRLGTSQPHLSRAMRNLEEAGMINRVCRRIRIDDKAAFARLLCTGCQAALRQRGAAPRSLVPG